MINDDVTHFISAPLLSLSFAISSNIILNFWRKHHSAEQSEKSKTKKANSTKQQQHKKKLIILPYNIYTYNECCISIVTYRKGTRTEWKTIKESIYWHGYISRVVCLCLYLPVSYWRLKTFYSKGSPTTTAHWLYRGAYWWFIGKVEKGIPSSVGL